MIKLPDFLITPYLLLEDKEIGLIDERLYGVIYWFTKLKNESCTASNETLAELVKTTPITIANSLKKLEDKGYIQRIFKDDKKRNRKEILPLVVFSKVSPTDESRKNDSLTGVSSIHSQMNRDSLTDEQNKNTNKNKNNIYVCFDLFWEKYPKKELKKKSQEIWVKNNLDEHLKEILSFIEQAKKSERWEKGYIKQPTTFLNNESWKDDVSAYGTIKREKFSTASIAGEMIL